MKHDRESQEIAPLTEQPRASFVLLSLLVALFATTFFVNTADWEISTYVDYSLSQDAGADQVAIGRPRRQIANFAIGMSGILMLVLPSRQRVRFANFPVALLCLYVLLCVASVFWSDVPWLTTKRVVLAIFGLLATFGAARQLSLPDIIDAALGIGAILLGISLYAELRLGTFAPLSSEYRFSGILHPNAQGGVCGLMVIAAFFRMKASDRGKLVYLGVLLIAGVFLVLTKSRTSFVACLCGIFAAWHLLTSRRQQVILSLGLPAAFCAGLMILLLLDTELTSNATTAANFGRSPEEDLMSFNGRIPLWTNLAGYIAARPLLGYGFQSFWTADRIYEVSLGVDWAAASAHSVFFDVLLSTGFVGIAVFGLGIIVTFFVTIKRCLKTMAPTDGFVFALLVYALIGSFFESGLSQPNGFEAFLTGVALLHILSRRTQAEPTRETTSRNAEPLANWGTVSAGGTA